LGTWLVQQQQTGINVPAAQVTSTDTPTGGSLLINMGAFSGPGDATSQVKASRFFTVNNPSEVVSIAQSFTSLLRSADVQATVRIVPISGTGSFSPSTLTGSAGSNPQTINRSALDSATLTGGVYQLIVTVRYTKTGNGLWNNTSPHRFDFTGV
jgi:hypothetical protein